METSLESRMLGNQPVRFGKGELETCQRLESGNGECRFNRSRQPFWRRGNALAIYFMKLLQCFLEFLHGDLCKAHAPRWKHNWHPVVNRCYLCVLMTAGSRWGLKRHTEMMHLERLPSLKDAGRPFGFVAQKDTHQVF